jgi:serine/threonine-protein kinase
MIRCPACSREIAADSVLCSYCGAAIQPRPAATVTTGPHNAPTVRDADFVTSSASIDDSRFTPGTLLAGRYRIVGRLGRGGMGEVYRADDLKLRQAVALKFLPAALTRDSRRLQRFHEEVRVARQVSHPNVCRMYDITEADGLHFLSMEFVDGGDLSTVLRRMGRPARDKALDIARQLCAGLAAAHDRGVLHRDLKPHNIMIDENGKVRITDFGLAGFVADFATDGGAAFAGTPAYMAPEQAGGGRVSVRSDIYSLGLVLFELFTGQRALAGSTRQEVEDSRGSLPGSLSSYAEDIDPAVERVVLRCLESDPAARPASALAVAAGLPGGDPLAAALAAGEMPAPALVAAAGGTGALRPAVALPCLAFVLAGTIAAAALRVVLLDFIPLDKPPEVLLDQATDILKTLGHATYEHRAFGFGVDNACLEEIAKEKSLTRWEVLRALRPPAVYFWARQSPRPLVPAPYSDQVTTDDPPPNISGMAEVGLDPRGRMLWLTVQPPQVEGVEEHEAPVPDADWNALFTAAELNREDFKPATPRWAPPQYCEQRAAWIGHHRDQPDVEIRVEAGAYRGKPNYFLVAGPWSRPWRSRPQEEPPGSTAVGLIILGVLLCVTLGSLVMARRNLRMRRGDRSGANRLALVLFIFTTAGWLLAISHVREPFGEFLRVRLQVGLAMVAAAAVWLLYIALEPYVRRRWPQTLISWNRLLTGRLRDPLVGRDMLFGAVAATALRLLDLCQRPVLHLLGLPDRQPESVLPQLSEGQAIGLLLDPTMVWFAFFILFQLFALRVLLRRPWLAVLAVLLLWVTPDIFMATPNEPLTSRIVVMLFGLLLISVSIWMLIRFGLLSLVAMFVVISWTRILITLDFSAWYAGGSLLAMGAVAALSIYAAHTALAGQPLLRDDLLEG